MWQARFYQSLPDLVQEYPKARWLFLTLTVRNCEISNLGDTLTAMNKAWQRLKDRADFKPVLGWVRTTEVTKGKDDSAHPHFHALLMVPPSMLSGKNYVKHARWVDMWRDCLRVDYSPNVDIRTVKPKIAQEGKTHVDSTIAALQGAVAETLKYSTKPEDMIEGDESWFLELTRQTHKRRFVATGGVLKNVLKVDQESDEDLALSENGDGTDDGSRLAFGWRTNERRYKRSPRSDSDGNSQSPGELPG
jgi:hypothetical protein